MKIDTSPKDQFRSELIVAVIYFRVEASPRETKHKLCWKHGVSHIFYLTCCLQVLVTSFLNMIMKCQYAFWDCPKPNIKRILAFGGMKYWYERHYIALKTLSGLAQGCTINGYLSSEWWNLQKHDIFGKTYSLFGILTLIFSFCPMWLLDSTRHAYQMSRCVERSKNTLSNVNSRTTAISNNHFSLRHH